MRKYKLYNLRKCLNDNYSGCFWYHGKGPFLYFFPWCFTNRSNRSSEGCGFDPRLGLRYHFLSIELEDRSSTGVLLLQSLRNISSPVLQRCQTLRMEDFTIAYTFSFYQVAGRLFQMTSIHTVSDVTYTLIALIFKSSSMKSFT